MAVCLLQCEQHDPLSPNISTCVSHFKGATSFIHRVNRLRGGVHFKGWAGATETTPPGEAALGDKTRALKNAIRELSANQSEQRRERLCLNALRKQAALQTTWRARHSTMQLAS